MILKLTEHKDDWPTQAANRIIKGDNAGAEWVFHHCMTQKDRDEFDSELVQMNHPLALEAGTQWSRFNTIAQELAQEFHEMNEANK